MNIDQELKKYKGFNEQYTQKISATLTNKIEDEIKNRITALGVDISDHEFIKSNFEFIEREGDDYKHLFYKAENKFIFSIQKVPDVVFAYDGKDFINNQITCKATYKYY